MGEGESRAEECLSNYLQGVLAAALASLRAAASSCLLDVCPLPHSTESAISKISPQFEGSVPNSFVEGRKQELQQQKVLTANGDPNGWHVLPIGARGAAKQSVLSP